MSQIGGDEWARFVARMRLTGGELISFSFRAERPKLAVIYINLVEDDEDDEDDEMTKMMKIMRTHSMKMMRTHFMKPS